MNSEDIRVLIFHAMLFTWCQSAWTVITVHPVAGVLSGFSWEELTWRPKFFPTAFCCGRSAARTSGMGPGPCLRGSSGGGASSSALRCHSRTLENEGQSTSRVSGFTNCWKKIPWVAFLHLWRMTVNTYPWGLQCEGDLSWESWGQLWAGHRGRWTGGRELLQPTWVWGLTHSCLHQESLV